MIAKTQLAAPDVPCGIRSFPRVIAVVAALSCPPVLQAQPLPGSWGAGASGRFGPNGNGTVPGIPANASYYGYFCCPAVFPLGAPYSIAEGSRNIWGAIESGIAVGSLGALQAESHLLVTGMTPNIGFTAESAFVDTLHIQGQGAFDLEFLLSVAASGSGVTNGAGLVVSARARFSLPPGNCYGYTCPWEQSGSAGTTWQSPPASLALPRSDSVVWTFQAGPTGARVPVAMALQSHAEATGWLYGARADVTASAGYDVRLLTTGFRMAKSSDIPYFACSSNVGVGEAKWLRWMPGALTPITQPGQINCSRPVVLYLHGWTGTPFAGGGAGPDECVERIAMEADRHYQAFGGAEVLVADMRQLLNPLGYGFNQSLFYTPLPYWTALTAANYLRATANMERAARELACDLENLGCASNIRVVFGHSLGGGIGGHLASELRRRSGGNIVVDTLVDLDTPYGAISLGNIGRDAGQAANRHVNIFATFLAGGVGAWVDNPNALNLRLDGVLRALSCSPSLPWPFHTCVVCAGGHWLEQGGLWNAIEGGLAPGRYYEDGQQWNLVPGSGPATTSTPDAQLMAGILGAGSHIAAWLIDVIDDFGLDFVRVGDEVHISTSGTELPGLAYGRYEMSANAGFLAFEYQLIEPGEDEVMSVSFGDNQLWAAYAATEPDQWQTGVVYVGNFAGATDSLVFSLHPGVANPPNDLLKVRNVRLYDNRVFPGFRGDVNLDSTLDGRDVSEFVAVLLEFNTDPPAVFAADLDGSGTVDVNDVSPFVIALLNG